jgi:hypothetical protein
MNKRIGLGLCVVGILASCASDDPGNGNVAQGANSSQSTVNTAVTTTLKTAVVPSASELARMTSFVKNRVAPSSVRRSLQTVGGRRVDCVGLTEQPALHKLRGQQLETPPQVAGEPALSAAELAARSAVGPEPLYEPGGAKPAACPRGTVPILEVTLADVSRFASLEDFFAKEPSDLRGATAPAVVQPNSELAPPHVGPTSLHQYAHAYRYVTNWGAETSISIASQATELNSEFSLGQIWVVAGSGSGLQTLEVGLQRYPNLYGDYNPHLFIYSTRGNYAPGTGCYNNTCGDFVQVSSTWFPGQGVGLVSVPGGAQYEINAHWAKAGDTGSWWLSVQGQWVGYYPRGLYTAAIDHAQVIDYGGEIIDGRNGGRHTLTDMGTGQFAATGWTHAAFMRLIRYNDSNPSANIITWTEAFGLTPTQSDPACYSIQLWTYNDPSWHIYFWYGGPGYSNPGCL